MNYDELILRSKTPNAGAPFPFLHQILRIALYDAYSARAFYTKFIEAFGAQVPLQLIANANDRTIATLTRLAQNYGVPRPLDPFPSETSVAPTWRENLERAVAGKIQSIELYHRLTFLTLEIDVQRAFVTLQNNAMNQELPPLQRALQQAVALENYHVSQGIPASQAYIQHGPLTNLLEQGLSLLARQNIMLGVASSLVKTADPAFLLGLIAGGASTHYVRKKLRKK